MNGASPPPEAGLDAAAFRAALGSFATGVTIITARAPDGGPVGVTANSFSSVSLEPALVLWSLNRRALSLPVFEAATHFAIHVLAADQAGLADRFATRGVVDKFAGLDWVEGEGGAPLLQGAAARFECSRFAAHDGGDHRIYIGQVLRFERSERPGLAFQHGAYAVLGAGGPPRAGSRRAVQPHNPREEREPVARRA
ncbi:MAG: flavin reductase family protein [Pseudomonadota bacterium]